MVVREPQLDLRRQVDDDRTGRHAADRIGRNDSRRRFAGDRGRGDADVAGGDRAGHQLALPAIKLFAELAGVTAGALGEIVQLNGNQHYTFPMRADAPPFDDVNVRNAVKHAVRRDELVEKILSGYGTVGNDDGTADMEAWEGLRARWDGEGAIRLLARDGWTLLLERCERKVIVVACGRVQRALDPLPDPDSSAGDGHA